jgi:hypothetical protein
MGFVKPFDRHQSNHHGAAFLTRANHSCYLLYLLQVARRLELDITDHLLLPAATSV